MSDEYRDYPEWLDRELFGDLAEDAPEKAAPRSQSAGTEKGEKREKRAASADEAPPGKKKKKTSASEPPREKSPGTKKPKAKADAPSDGKAPKAKKSAPDKTAPAPKAKNSADEKKDAPKTPAKAGTEGKKPKEKPDDGKNAEQRERERAEKEKAERSRRKKAGKAARGGLIALIVVVSLALLLSVGAFVASNLLAQSTVNLPNVYLGDVYVGGMTKEQTVQALRDALWDEKNGGTLNVKLPENVSFELDYLQAGVSITAEAAAEKAYAYGRGEDQFLNLLTYVRDLLAPQDLSGYEPSIDESYIRGAVNAGVDEFEAVTKGEEYKVNEKESTLEVVKGAGQITIDRSALSARAREALLARDKELVWDEIVTDGVHKPDFAAIAASLTEVVHNAYYDPTTGEVVPDAKGVELDVNEAGKLWEKAGILEKISIPIKLVEPEVTASELEEMLFRDQLGYCKTSLIGSSANRKSNIALACSHFDGTILMPGQRFSYNEAVGERTIDNGFKVAPVYNGTAHEEGVGGGICQVSSTLYNAVQLANLKVNERTSHSMRVAYLPAGRDATVDWPDTDFVFTNDREFPVMIKASVDASNRNVEISIWGSNVDGSYVEIRSAEWAIYDDEYQEKYGLKVHIADGAWNCRRVFDANGNYFDTDKVYSYYHIPEEDISWPAIPGEDDGDDGGGDDGGYEPPPSVDPGPVPDPPVPDPPAPEPEPEPEPQPEPEPPSGGEGGGEG